MNKSELALSLIRAPWLTRLTDRTFLLALAGGLIALLMWNQGAINGDAAMTALTVFWGGWLAAHEARTGAIAVAAVKADPAPQQLAVGTLATTDATTDATPPAAATNVGAQGLADMHLEPRGDDLDNDGDGPQDDEADQ